MGSRQESPPRPARGRSPSRDPPPPRRRPLPPPGDGVVWLYVPTSPCVPESAALTSDSTSPPLPPGSFALWRGKPLQPQSWRRVCKTAPWTRLLFGAISDPSTADRGVAAWIASLPATPASRSAWPGSELGLTTPATSGPMSPGSSERYAPRTPFLRTSEDTFRLDSPTCLPTLPTSGSMRSGSCWERTRWVPRTSETGCSSWPTPDAGALGDTGSEATWAEAVKRNKEKFGNGNGHGRLLAMEARTWQTPTSTDSVGRDYCYPGGDKTKPFLTLVGQAQEKQWATPTSRDHKDGACADQDVPTNALLGRQTARWFPSGPPAPTTPRDGPASSPSGPTSPRRWSTPISGDAHLGSNQDAAQRRMEEGKVTLSRQVEVAQTGKRRLNPAFVEWLMGWPPGWTDFAPVATASYRSRQRWLLQRLLTGLGSICSLDAGRKDRT